MKSSNMMPFGDVGWIRLPSGERVYGIFFLATCSGNVVSRSSQKVAKEAGEK